MMSQSDLIINIFIYTKTIFIKSTLYSNMLYTSFYSILYSLCWARISCFVLNIYLCILSFFCYTLCKIFKNDTSLLTTLIPYYSQRNLFITQEMVPYLPIRAQWVLFQLTVPLIHLLLLWKNYLPGVTINKKTLTINHWFFYDGGHREWNNDVHFKGKILFDCPFSS